MTAISVGWITNISGAGNTITAVHRGKDAYRCAIGVSAIIQGAGIAVIIAIRLVLAVVIHAVVSRTYIVIAAIFGRKNTIAVNIGILGAAVAVIATVRAHAINAHI